MPQAPVLQTGPPMPNALTPKSRTSRRFRRPRWLAFPLLAAVSAVSSACRPDPCGSRPLVAPPPALVQTARAFIGTRLGTGARVYFSQNHERVLWIDGLTAPVRPIGLENATAEELAPQVLSFVRDHRDLFMLSAPESSLRLDAGFLGSDPDPGSARILRFQQLHDGTPVEGAYLLAFVDAHGSLRGLQSELLPEADLAAARFVDEAAGLPPMSATRSGLTRQKWVPAADGYRRVVEESRAEGPYVRRIWRDPRTGIVLRELADLPSLGEARPGWEAGGQRVSAAARDPRGEVVEIPSTRAGDELVLGFAQPGILSCTEAVRITDAAMQFGLMPVGALATRAASWLEEPEFDARLVDATRLARNVETTLHWFKDRLGLDSWDGFGAGIQGVVRARMNEKEKDEPDLNAYGGNGWILIGDGRTGSNHSFGDSLTIVAHEFAHSVVRARIATRYEGEGAAIHESLADVFGKSVEGYASMVVGHDIGHEMRHMTDPGQFGDPGDYADFRSCPADHDTGGAHSNAGILNRALTLWIQGDARSGGVGIPHATRFLLKAFHRVPFPEVASMENFAAALAAYCFATEPGGESCGLLEARLRETRLLGAPVATGRME